MFNPFQKSLTHKKESVMGAAALGGFLLLACFPLLFWNEGRAVTTARSLAEGADAVVAVDAARVDPANEGKFVHLTGKANTSETLVDDQFGVSVNALRLSRHVEMYQWREIEEEVTKKREGEASKTVTEYSYEQTWSSEPIDSSTFHVADGHQNPPRMPMVSRTIEAADIRVEAYRLPSSLVAKIDRSEPLMVDLANVPQPLANSLRAEGGSADNAQGFYWPVAGNQQPPAVEPLSTEEPPAEDTTIEPLPTDDGESIDEDSSDSDPVQPDLETEDLPTEPSTNDAAPAEAPESDAPQIGDLRIHFTATYPAEVSILSQQVGESLQPFQTKAGDRLQMLSIGHRTAEEMIASAQAANTFMTWAIRIVGLFMSIAGVALVLRPLTMFTDWVPVLGNLVGFGVFLIAVAVGGAASLVTIAVAWLFYRPLLAISILVVAALLVVGVVFAIKSLRGSPTSGE